MGPLVTENFGRGAVRGHRSEVRAATPTETGKGKMTEKMTGPELDPIGRNIRAVENERARTDGRRRIDARTIDLITAYAGSPRSLYLHAIFYAGCLTARYAHTDLVATLEGIFLAIFVLINQKQMKTREGKDSDLHLQMSMLAEHEVTRIAQVTDLIAKKLGLDTDHIVGLEEAKADIDPNDILNRLPGQK